MQQNELVIRTYEIILFGTFQGLPVEQCEYKEVMDFFKELYEYLVELVKNVMEVIVEAFKNVAWVYE